MTTISVPVTFVGVIDVSVPDAAADNPELARMLAGKFAVCFALATADCNPDAPEEAAYDDFIEEGTSKFRECTSELEAWWDACECVGVGGGWSDGPPRGANEARLLQALKDLTMTTRTFRDVPVDDQMWTTLDDAALDQAFDLIGELDPNYINETSSDT